MKSRFKVLLIMLFVPVIFSFLIFFSSAEAGGEERGEEKEWCTVSFYNRDEIWYEEKIEEGGVPTSPPPPKRDGYKFSGWESSVGRFESGARVYESIRYDAVYELLPPSFEISSLSFEYDGSTRELSFTEINHPYLDEGLLSYEWFRDGVPLGVYSPTLPLCNVSDSAQYTVKLTFSVMGDVATVTTSPISVEITKKQIPLPKIPDATYTGNEIYPEIFDTGAYSVEKSSYTLTGVYPIKVTLKDSDNYAFFGTAEPFCYVDFVINSAQNYFIDELRINDIYTSGEPAPYALARFGEVEFLYCGTIDGTFTPNPPIYSGEYYVKAVVCSSDCYSGLESRAVKFSVIEELVSGIAINTYPTHLKYKAFDALIRDGLSVSVSYNSGRREIVYGEDVTVEYMSADSLRYGDKGVILSYGGASVLLLVDVGKADYDISGISFSDSCAVYSGKEMSPVFSGVLPKGKDGIPLTATVVGGGVDVGVYRVSLVFSTESKNYNTPSQIFAEFIITPAAATVVWENLEFVYDGTPKLPSAFYTDQDGRRVTLFPIGERSNAGEYTASVESVDPNYYLVNPTALFTVMKARYDMSGVLWRGGGERYDGEKKRVELTNLPDGVYVVGYVNAVATDCARYVARATLSYDDKNYEMPIVPDYEWEIVKGEYELSCFDFLDNTAIYTGENHYPTLSGTMPVGADGIMLEYEFSTCATNVSDGEVTVEIRFFTKSENYNTPSSIFRKVTITPAGITVNWHSLYFVYSGKMNIPYAESEVSEITVGGGACDAGEYIATATAANPNYYVINDTVGYTVARASNAWRVEPSITDVFFGDMIAPQAEALGGEIEFKYYSDADCHKPLSSMPLEVGVYYMIATSSGGKNYLEITSSPVKFEIIAVVPTGIEIELNGTRFVALDVIKSTDFFAYLCHNNGTKAEIPAEDVKIVYTCGESIIYGDGKVGFEYGGFFAECEISVEKRAYDLSGVKWCDTVFVYDGTQKSAYLSGLPEGVSVTAYNGNGRVGAGSYTVTAELEYDSHNYQEPKTESATLTIKKQIVPAPIIESIEYDGKQKHPSLPNDPRYTHTYSFTAKNSGNYGISFQLVDGKNFAFDNGEESTTVDFIVRPRLVEITLSDVDRYLFERDSSIKADWRIVAGTVIPGDDLCLSFYVDGDMLSAVSQNPNYTVKVNNARVIRHSMPSPYFLSSFFVFFVLMLIIILITVLILIKRKRIQLSLVTYAENTERAEILSAPVPDMADKEPQIPTECEATEPTAPASDDASSMAVSVDYADSAITNSLAKDLIRHDDNVITRGTKRGIVNVDTLSRSFDAGERVDINALKNKSLIPYDTGYIKVLARGIIDKPLYVYANDFSLAAVKMIALTGGKAIKVNTSKNKSDKQ